MCIETRPTSSHWFPCKCGTCMDIDFLTLATKCAIILTSGYYNESIRGLSGTKGVVHGNHKLAKCE